MSKSNIQRKSKKYVTFLKLLTKWLGNKRRNPDQIKTLIDKYNVDNTIMRRILTYLIGAPHIQWYCNKYLNNKYDFHKAQTEDLLFTLVHIMDVNKCTDTRKFYFMKSTDSRDTIRYPFKQLLSQYFDLSYNMYYNEKELNFLYRLFTLNEITYEQINNIDIMINNKQTLKLEAIESQQFEDSKKKVDPSTAIPQISEPIQQYINDMQNLKSQNCVNCPMYPYPMVVIDTNCETFDNIDIMFLGLNPGVDEATQNRPFIGDSGMEIRKIIAQLPDNVKWVLGNFIFCATSNKTELEKVGGSVAKIQDQCSNFAVDLIQKFPAKYYVPVGGDALQRFKITDKTISHVSGEIFDIQVIDKAKIIPLIHPSSVLRSRNRYEGIFNKSCQTIIDQFKSYKPTKQKSTPQKTQQQNLELANDNIITNVDDSLTFFDVRELDNNRILSIYIDKEGKKKYKIDNYNFEFYIKPTQWDTCGMINTNMDYKVVIDGHRKYQVTKTVREYLNDMKRS